MPKIIGCLYTHEYNEHDGLCTQEEDRKHIEKKRNVNKSSCEVIFHLVSLTLFSLPIVRGFKQTHNARL